MFITRASRRDHDEIKDFYRSNDWGDNVDLSRGVAFIARQGPVVGAVRLIEVAPQTVIVEDVVVAGEHRCKGVGRRLMEAAMNSRGGSMYLCCHDDVIPFYENFSFAAMPFEEIPESAQEYFRSIGDYPTEPGHVHYFLKAR
ncbi:MAG: GNAT family N-acetyltransferase [Actinomycetota bacterium]